MRKRWQRIEDALLTTGNLSHILQLTVGLIIAGLLLFVTLATFDQETYTSATWGHIYALWAKITFTLLAYIGWRSTYEKHGHHLRPVFWICIIRLVWDIVAWVGGWGINEMTAVSILFLIYLSYVSYKAFTNVRN